MFRMVLGNTSEKRHADVAAAGNATDLPRDTPNSQAAQCAIGNSAVFRSISPTTEARLALVAAATGDGKVVCCSQVLQNLKLQWPVPLQ
jgi:hypothetical protein